MMIVMKSTATVSSVVVTVKAVSARRLSSRSRCGRHTTLCQTLRNSLKGVTVVSSAGIFVGLQLVELSKVNSRGGEVKLAASVFRVAGG